MKKSHKNEPFVRTILYILGVSLLFLGLFSFPFLGDYMYISFVLIISGIIIFAAIPLRRK